MKDSDIYRHLLAVIVSVPSVAWMNKKKTDLSQIIFFYAP